jgi:hypothetical protein
MKNFLITLALCSAQVAFAQEDTTKNVLPPFPTEDSLELPIRPLYLDTALRIMNVNPYFTLHVDSVLNYDFIINRDSRNYFWFLVNSPLGARIDRNTGNLYIKADKGLFRSGRLKYDVPYKVQLGVQNLYNPMDRVDTSFTVVYYSTEVVLSKLKPTSSSVISVEEGDSVQFKIQCDEGTFPIEQISINTSMPISGFTPVRRCNEEFKWVIPFGIFRDNDTARQRTVVVDFIGSDKFFNRDTVSIRINIRPGINYAVRNEQHKVTETEFYRYIQNLKLSFYVVSKSVKKNRSSRTAFDIGGSTTALAGTVMNATSERGSKAEAIGKVMPSVGLTLVPVKEAAAPNKVQEQNTATQLRAEVKRLEYILSENKLNGSRDIEVLAKTRRLQEELKKSRMQFLDIPFDFDEKVSDADADKFFKDPKVNKNYRLKVN